ncbi:MAG TPA: hypothetical protein VF677_08515 [Flavobacterium sp.]|jgi:glutamate synthase domain-containing protein 1
MKYIVLIFSIIFFQTPRLVTLKDYYRGEGIIFDENTKFPFNETNYNKPYIPSLENIKKGETFLFENYYEYEISILEHYKLEKSIIKNKYKNPKNVRRKFNQYNRQYISYISKENDTILYIGLLNFSNKQKANKYFESWKKFIYGGAGDFYYKNQKYYIVNLSKRKFIYKIVGISN